MKQYFGTDGIRGIPNENLTKEIVSNVACSVEEILKPTSVAVILDTRNSSVEILDWICEGFSENIEVINYGVLPSGSMPILLNHFGFMKGMNNYFFDEFLIKSVMGWIILCFLGIALFLISSVNSSTAMT